MAQFFRSTLIGGLLFMLPFAVLGIVLSKVASALKPLVDALAERLPFESFIGLKIPVLLTGIIIVVICFMAGVLARTDLAKRFVQGLEEGLLNKIPGYSLLKDISEDVSVPKDKSTHNAVLVRFDDAWQLGLRIEELADHKHVAVFIPDSPTPQTGSVLIVTSDRVKPTNIPMLKLFSCLKDRGKGIDRLLK
jgi:uncharacterized membrane protein